MTCEPISAASKQEDAEDPSQGCEDIVNSTEVSEKDVDGGWAWVVLCSCTIGSAIGGGQFFNSGIYFFVFLQEFQQSRSYTMWITAAQGTSSAVAGLIASNLVVILGPRKMMLIGSVVMGTSYGLMFFANSVAYGIVCFAAAGAGAAFLLLGNIDAMGYYFKRKLNVAMGVVLAGSGLGVTIVGLEIEWAVKYFGWRGAMLIQAGLLYQISACAATIYTRRGDVIGATRPQVAKRAIVISTIETVDDDVAPSKQPVTVTIPSTTPKISHKYLVEPKFWVQLLAFTFYFASVTVTYQILKDFVITQGFSFSYNTVMICTGVANGVGRVLGGFLASLVIPTLLNSIVTVLCSGTIATFLAYEYEWIILVGITLFGLSNGLQGSPQTVSWATLFGKDMMAAMFGYSLASGGIPSLSMSPLAGLIIDKTGSFMPVIALSSLCMMISGLLFLATHCMHRRKTGNHKFNAELGPAIAA